MLALRAVASPSVVGPSLLALRSAMAARPTVHAENAVTPVRVMAPGVTLLTAQSQALPVQRHKLPPALEGRVRSTLKPVARAPAVVVPMISQKTPGGKS